MTSFDFQPRTRVVFGSGTLARLGSLAKELGFLRTLLVADAGVVQAGYVAAAADALASAGIEATPFHDFGQNPDSAMVENGRVFAAPLGLDSIIGLGGGSSLDCAKGINFLLTNGGKMADYRGYAKATRPLLPMIGIPTTAGTGSEAQSYAVISDASTHMKMACGDPSAAVKLAILDPDLTMSAPRRVTAMAGYDAIAHAVETWVTTRRTPMSETFSVRAWELLRASFERVLENPGDREARASMLLGSHFAGIAIEQSMLGAAHACSNPLTARLRPRARPGAVDTPADRRPMERHRGVRPIRGAHRIERSQARIRAACRDTRAVRRSRRAGRQAAGLRRCCRRAARSGIACR